MLSQRGWCCVSAIIWERGLVLSLRLTQIGYMTLYCDYAGSVVAQHLLIWFLCSVIMFTKLQFTGNITSILLFTCAVIALIHSIYII